jgi:hypothetical protein
MNEMRTRGLRLPVQMAVDRTATYATLAEGSGVEASQGSGSWWPLFQPVDPPNLVGFPLLPWSSARQGS